MGLAYLNIRDFSRDCSRDQPPGEFLASENRYKLELDTPLERFFHQGILAGVLLTLLGVLMFFKGNPAWAVFLWLSLGLTVFSLIARLGCDNFYVIDLPRRALMYRFRFFLVERYTELAPLHRLLAVAIDGRPINRRRIQQWGFTTRDVTYGFAMVLVLRDGRVFPVSDYVENDAVGVEQSARRLSARFGIPFHPGKLRGQVLTVSTSEGPLEVRPVFHSGLGDMNFFSLAILVAGLILAGFLR